MKKECDSVSLFIYYEAIDQAVLCVQDCGTGKEKDDVWVWMKRLSGGFLWWVRVFV